jgi:putative tryptophan/tyrosine transport system substrate-binding protein
MTVTIGRRELLVALSGAAAWPLAARAQQPERVRRIDIMSGVRESDPDAMARYTALRQVLQQLGWSEGRNIRFDYRFGMAGNRDLMRKYVAELIALQPDVILAAGTPTVGALQSATRTVPIVFAGIIDPVGSGLVASLARPGGNTTGFISYEYGLSVKWLELLKEIAPAVTRIGVVREAGSPAGIGLWAAMQGAASTLKTELSPVDIRDEGDIVRLIGAFAHEPNSGLIVTSAGLTITHRDQISTVAARQRLPAVYSFRYFVIGGGLLSYGPDEVDSYRQAAGYIDRILKGEKPANLPVQAPTKYDLVINLKTAKALGLEVPSTLLARADEVIE